MQIERKDRHDARWLNLRIGRQFPGTTDIFDFRIYCCNQLGAAFVLFGFGFRGWIRVRKPHLPGAEAQGGDAIKCLLCETILDEGSIEGDQCHDCQQGN